MWQVCEATAALVLLWHFSEEKMIVDSRAHRDIPSRQKQRRPRSFTTANENLPEKFITGLIRE